MKRARLDVELVRRGLAPSRTAARELVDAGRVTVAGAPARKAATLVDPAAAVAVRPGAAAWASRGGSKLAGALEVLDVPVVGRHALDAGASTGGFTDVLLDRGAARVVAVDVGYGQLRWRLRTDERVVVLDRTNVRHITPADVPEPRPDLVVADLSFISLRLVLPALVGLAERPADLVLLVKPQFEVGPDAVGSDGVVRDPRSWFTAVSGVAGAGEALGAQVVGCAPSPLPGPAGNIEFFVHLQLGDAGPPPATGSEASSTPPASLSHQAAAHVARAVDEGGILAAASSGRRGPTGDGE